MHIMTHIHKLQLWIRPFWWLIIYRVYYLISFLEAITIQVDHLQDDNIVDTSQAMN